MRQFFARLLAPSRRDLMAHATARPALRLSHLALALPLILADAGPRCGGSNHRPIPPVEADVGPANGQ